MLNSFRNTFDESSVVVQESLAVLHQIYKDFVSDPEDNGDDDIVAYGKTFAADYKGAED